MGFVQDHLMFAARIRSAAMRFPTHALVITLAIFTHLAATDDTCESPTITVSDDASFASATNCAVLVDNVKILNNTIYIWNYGISPEGETLVTDMVLNFSNIEALTDVFIQYNDTAPKSRDSNPTDLQLQGPMLRKISGDVRVQRSGPYHDFGVSLYFPVLERMGEIFVQGDFDGLDVSSFPGNMTASGVRQYDTSSSILALDILSIGDSGFMFMDNQGSGSGFLRSSVTSISGPVVITNNSGVNEVSLLNLERSNTVSFAHNPDLRAVNWGGKIVDVLNFQLQNNQMTEGAFNDLETISRGARLNGFSKLLLPVLKRIDGFLTSGPVDGWMDAGVFFIDNSIPALHLPLLNSVNGSFQIQNNPSLYSVHIPSLQYVYSDFTVRNNTLLRNLTANVLRRASSIEIDGPFTNVELFSLEEVSGDFYVQGTPSMDCTWFNDNLQGRVVKGTFTCIGNQTYPPTPRRPTSPTLLPGETPTSQKNNNGVATGVKIGIGVGAGLGFVVLAGLGTWAFLRLKAKRVGMWKQQADAELEVTNELGGVGREVGELTDTGRVEAENREIKAELGDEARPTELGVAQEAFELD